MYFTWGPYVVYNFEEMHNIKPFISPIVVYIIFYVYHAFLHIHILTYGTCMYIMYMYGTCM